MSLLEIAFVSIGLGIVGATFVGSMMFAASRADDEADRLWREEEQRRALLEAGLYRKRGSDYEK